MLKCLAIGLLALFASLDVTIGGGDPRPVGCDKVHMGGPGGGAPHPVSCAKAR